MAGIDNLGDYGKITQLAKAAGGVSKLLNSVSTKAVAEAAPRLRAQGLAVGAILGAGGTALYQRVNNKRNATIAEGAAAEAEIRRIVAEAEEAEADTVEEPAADASDKPDEPRDS